MKILYLLKQDPDDTLKRIVEAQKANHEVVEIDLRTDVAYSELVSLIAESDKVISW